MAYQNWEWIPAFKMSTNKTLMDVMYVVIPPEVDAMGRVNVPEDKMAITLVAHDVTPHITLRHFINADTFHGLAHAVLMSSRHFAEFAGVALDSTTKAIHWTDYKGTTTPSGVVSNRLTVSLSLATERKSPWILAIETGEGTKTATGAVLPKRDAATTKVLIYATTAQMRSLMLMALEQGQAVAGQRLAQRAYAPQAVAVSQ